MQYRTDADADADEKGKDRYRVGNQGNIQTLC
jgi:hypothetical protein